MTEKQILEVAIAYVRAGKLLDACTVLQQSKNPQTRENADNCMRLALSPHPFLESMLLEVLERQLEWARTFEI